MALPIKSKIKAILKLIIEPKVFLSLISLRAWGYLLDIGWFNSFKLKMPVDININPIPWFTYPAIEFLSSRLNRSMKVFEFGSGNSTIYFAGKVESIVSVEHNEEWFEKISKSLPSNSNLHLADSNIPASYLKTLLASDEKFNIIVVDGIFRNECLIECINYLSEDGIIILDDSERMEYKNGISFLLNMGLKQLDFWGISPGYLYRKATSIFYKKINCLNI